MVYRIYVEKKPGFDVEATGLKNELTSLLGIQSLTGLRLLNRYDVEGIDEELFNQCANTVFSEPPVDNTYAELPASDGVSFAVEYLPGQFDQRADSAAECIQLISQGERPLVRSARVYLLEGALTPEQVAEIKKYVINPVEAREASLETKETLKMDYPVPAAVAVLEGFNQLDEAGLAKFIEEKGLAMDLGDIKFCQEYFRTEQRDPTITEIKMIDTYWSDHCRHTTFGTILDDVQIDDAVVQEAFDRYMAMRTELGRENKPRCMMDLATIGAKELKKQGILKNLDESEEINACTVKIKCDVNGKDEDWLFLFKNETHNHPTEIEPLRRCCNLHRWCHPRPAVRPQLRLSGYARHRRRRPAQAGQRDHARQAAPAQAGHHRSRRLLLLRQPDRSGYRSGGRDLPPWLCGKAHGDRRCCGCYPCLPRPPRVPRSRRCDRAAGRPHRP